MSSLRKMALAKKPLVRSFATQSFAYEKMAHWLVVGTDFFPFIPHFFKIAATAFFGPIAAE